MALKLQSPSTEINDKMTNLLKIENFLNDSSYSELIEYSANFNARLCIERRLRLPFLDPQTGVAQKHSNLYLKKSQRLPGLKEGQIYTYPSPRWRCKKSSVKFSSRPFYRFRAADNCTTMLPPSLGITSGPTSTIISALTATEGEKVNDFQALIDAESNSLGAADTDSKDSQNLKEESMSKDWFYEDILEGNDVGSEEQADSDFEYNINGYKRKKKPVTTRKSSRKPKEPSESARKSRSNFGGSSSTRNRNRKSSTRSSSKPSSKTEGRNFADVEPPSFADVQPFDGAYL